MAKTNDNYQNFSFLELPSVFKLINKSLKKKLPLKTPVKNNFSAPYLNVGH
jgi:hypothetical protein